MVTRRVSYYTFGSELASVQCRSLIYRRTRCFHFVRGDDKTLRIPDSRSSHLTDGHIMISGFCDAKQSEFHIKYTAGEKVQGGEGPVCSFVRGDARYKVSTAPSDR